MFLNKLYLFWYDWYAVNFPEEIRHLGYFILTHTVQRPYTYK